MVQVYVTQLLDNEKKNWFKEEKNIAGARIFKSHKLHEDFNLNLVSFSFFLNSI